MSATRSILLDTHFLLWMRAAPEKLDAAERRIIDQAAERFVSAVSLWEIAILVGLGRVADDARLFDVPAGCTLLPILSEHCVALAKLPQIHRDPFDRMLIAQARTEGLGLLTRDAWIAEYGPDGCALAKS